LTLASSNAVLSHINGGALDNPRVTVEPGDGYYYLRNRLRNSAPRYDAIFVDFPSPNDYNLARLYSREFFSLLRQQLSDDGYAVFDATGISRLTDFDSKGRQKLQTNNQWSRYYNTLRAAGFTNHQIVPYLSNLIFDESLVVELLKQSPTRQRLAEENAEQLERAVSAAHRKRLLDGLIRDRARELIHSEMRAYQQGFIMLSAIDGIFKRQFGDPAVELNVLNERRFERAFIQPFPRSELVDKSLVNSILRPTFPAGSIWKPKLPY